MVYKGKITPIITRLILLSVTFFLTASLQAQAAETVAFYGYDDCIKIENEDAEVILCPAAGGRVLKYALKSGPQAQKNILYLPKGREGWVWDGKTRGQLPAGRFDIGPEQVVPRRDHLWLGRWSVEFLAARSVQLASQVDPSAGVKLVRIFSLAESGTKLDCEQRIINATEQPVEYCHWSRTFVHGTGRCIVPLTRPSRYSESYVRYDPPGKMLNMKPSDDHVKYLSAKSGDYLIITDRPQNPKLGFDSHAGWLAYESPQDLLFIKTFPTYPDRAYNEVAGLTISIWYPKDPLVELEPIGPRERLEKKGDQASFTETWYLRSHSYPAKESSVDTIARIIEQID